MSDEAELFSLDSKKRQQIVDELGHLKRFLRQQNPLAFLKIQLKNSSSFTRSTSEQTAKGSLPAESHRLDVRTPSQEKQKSLKLNETQSLEKSQTARSDAVSPPLSLQRDRGESSNPKFGDLIAWMRKKFPHDRLLPAYSAKEPIDEQNSQPIVLLVTEAEGAKKAASKGFLQKVTDALLSRNVTTENLIWGRWNELADLDLSKLKLIIGPSDAKEHLIKMKENSPNQPLFLSINWSECAQNKEQKAQLWDQIKSHLQQESR